MSMYDVKKYYYQMFGACVEAKRDLADFEEAFQNGYITEDKLEYVKEDLVKIQDNFDRIQFIMYLLEKPKETKNKRTQRNREQYIKVNSALLEHFKDIGVDTDSLISESKDLVSHMRAELKKLSNSEEGK